MASVPQSMMMARSKKKKLERGIFNQSDAVEQRYNNKMMNSIWGQYNRYSVHNMKSMQNEEVLDMSAPPVIQIMREQRDQYERSGSPVLQMLQNCEMGRSKPISIASRDHHDGGGVDFEGTESPSILMEEEVASNSWSHFQRIINAHRDDWTRRPSPLLQLAKGHYERMNPLAPLEEPQRKMFGTAEPGISHNFGNAANEMPNVLSN